SASGAGRLAGFWAIGAEAPTVTGAISISSARFGTGWRGVFASRPAEFRERVADVRFAPFHFFSGAAGGPASGLRGWDGFRPSMLNPYAGFGVGIRCRAGIGSSRGHYRLRFGRFHFSFTLQLAERGEGAFEDAAETGFVRKASARALDSSARDLKAVAIGRAGSGRVVAGGAV